MGLVALILGSCHTKTEFSYLKFRRAPFTESINKPGFKKFIFQFLLTDVNQPHPNLLYYAINDSNTIIGHGVLDYLMDSTSKTFSDTAVLGNLELTNSYIVNYLKLKNDSDFVYLVPIRRGGYITYLPYVNSANRKTTSDLPPPLDPTPPARPAIFTE